MKHELTITLKPIMYTKTAKEQFDMTYQYVLDILKPYKHTTVAELTVLNNVHYHSLIDIEGIIQKDILLNRIRPYKLLGKPHCTAVQYEVSYENYLLKDIIETNKVINRYPLIKDDWNLMKSEKTFSDKIIRIRGRSDVSHASEADNSYHGTLMESPLPPRTALPRVRSSAVNWDALNFGIDFTNQKI